METCGKCDRGYLLIRDASGHEQAVECECRKQIRLVVAMDEAGIFPEFRPYLDPQCKTPGMSREQKDVHKAVQDYIGDLKARVVVGDGFYLYSAARGTGKTTHLLMILSVALRAGYTVRNIHWWDLMRVMITEPDELEAIKDVGVLMIDELGKEGAKKETDFPRAMFDYLLRHRLSRLKPTLLASNLEPAEFDEKYGTGVKSLFTKHIRVMPMHGVDWRGT